MTRICWVLAGAPPAFGVAYAVQLTGPWIIRWRYREGSGM